MKKFYLIVLLSALVPTYAFSMENSKKREKTDSDTKPSETSPALIIKLPNVLLEQSKNNGKQSPAPIHEEDSFNWYAENNPFFDHYFDDYASNLLGSLANEPLEDLFDGLQHHTDEITIARHGSNLRDAVQDNDIIQLTNILRDCPGAATTVNEQGETALHQAAKVGNYQCLLLLIPHSDIAARTHIRENNSPLSRATPLHYAAFYKHVDCFKKLIRKGASIWDRTEKNYYFTTKLSPFHLLCESTTNKNIISAYLDEVRSLEKDDLAQKTVILNDEIVIMPEWLAESIKSEAWLTVSYKAWQLLAPVLDDIHELHFINWCNSFKKIRPAKEYYPDACIKISQYCKSLNQEDLLLLDTLADILSIPQIREAALPTHLELQLTTAMQSPQETRNVVLDELEVTVPLWLSNTVERNRWKFISTEGWHLFSAIMPLVYKLYHLKETPIPHSQRSYAHYAYDELEKKFLKEFTAYCKKLHLDQLTQLDNTVLHLNALKLSRITQLLRKKAALKSTGIELTSDQALYPLHELIRLNQPEALRIALHHTACIDTFDAIGHTPLMVAVLTNNLACLKLLITYEANLNDRVEDHRSKPTVLHLAARKEKFECFVELLKAGADPTAVCDHGRLKEKPLACLIRNSSKQEVTTLLDTLTKKECITIWCGTTTEKLSSYAAFTLFPTIKKLIEEKEEDVDQSIILSKVSPQTWCHIQSLIGILFKEYAAGTRGICHEITHHCNVLQKDELLALDEAARYLGCTLLYENTGPLRRALEDDMHALTIATTGLVDQEDTMRILLTDEEITTPIALAKLSETLRNLMVDSDIETDALPLPNVSCKIWNLIAEQSTLIAQLRAITDLRATPETKDMLSKNYMLELTQAYQGLDVATLIELINAANFLDITGLLPAALRAYIARVEITDLKNNTALNPLTNDLKTLAEQYKQERIKAKRKTVQHKKKKRK